FTSFLVAGSAGTTNTGAVDDLAGLARIAREQSLWLRRRRVRRVLQSDGAREGAAARHRRSGFRDPRSAQDALPAIRNGCAARERCASAARRAFIARRLSSGNAG